MSKNPSVAYKYVLLAFLIICCTIAIVASITMLSRANEEYTEGEQVYEELTQYVINPSLPSDAPIPSTPESDNWPSVDFEALREINPDIVAWLICEDTVINYPVVQGRDNDYYLKRLFDGKRNSAGCLFVDSGNSPGFVDHNTVIYGHNMKNKSMFSVLVEYKTQAFYDAHLQMILLTAEGNYSIELFAGYVASTKADSWELWFASNTEFEDWIHESRQRSSFTSSVEASTSDRFITLSTCSHEFDNARYVVVGKLIPIIN